MVLIFIPFILFIAVAVGALLLRAAVSLANKVLGPVGPPAMPESGLPISSDGFKPQASDESPFAIQTQMPAEPSDLDGNPFATPAVAATGAIPSAPGTRNAIKEPDFGKAMGIVFLSGVATGILNFLFGLISSEVRVEPILVIPLNLVLGVLITIFIYAGMLPTTFGKAALVYLFYVLIAIAVAGGIFGVVFGIQVATGIL